MTTEQYIKINKETRKDRISWWDDAKFGMMVHYGIYSCYGRGEWIKMREGISDEEYRETLETQFRYESGNAEAWVKLAKRAGAKYVVVTTQHHDGFALWDSKVNPYNSAQMGPKVDIIREYVDACRKHDLKIGLYFSLWNWQHPDGMRCVEDEEARVRFTDYVYEEVKELMSNYGKIDILWYDVPSPLQTAEEWESLKRNRMVRELQPQILINNRSRLEEDFSTPEDQIVSSDGYWEACMRFANIAFGGLDHDKALPYKINAHDIVKLLSRCEFSGGNLLFNISPDGRGAIDPYEKETLETVGRWIAKHGESVYGAKDKGGSGANGICTSMKKGNTVYLWNWTWPGTWMRINGYKNAPKSVTCVTTGETVDFRYEKGVIYFENLPSESPDEILNITVFKMEFGDEEPKYNLIPQNAIQFMGI